jgi:hypothetical protein
MPKSGIALHHTVCDDAHTTVSLWRADKTAAGTPRHVATVYVIDRDGTVFELFDPAAWRFTWVCLAPRIAERDRPRIRLPSIVGFVGAVGVGLVVGRVIR